MALQAQPSSQPTGPAGEGPGSLEARWMATGGEACGVALPKSALFFLPLAAYGEHNSMTGRWLYSMWPLWIPTSKVDLPAGARAKEPSVSNCPGCNNPLTCPLFSGFIVGTSAASGETMLSVLYTAPSPPILVCQLPSPTLYCTSLCHH